MHLDHLHRDLFEGFAGLDSGHAGRDVEFLFLVGERPCAVVGIAPREFDLAPHVRQSVLDALEGGHRSAECIAAQGELLGDVEAGLGGSELFKSHQGGGPVEQVTGEGFAIAVFAQEFCGGSVELDPCHGSARVEGGHGFALNTLALEIDQIEGEAIGTLCGDHGKVRNIPVDYGKLRSADFSVGDLGLNIFDVILAGLFRERESPDGCAAGQVGQVLLFLLIAACLEEGLGGEVDAGGEGDGGQGAADFFGDHCQFQVAKARSAVLLGNHGALPAHFGGALPQVVGIGLLGFENFPASGKGGVFGQIIPSGLLQELLVV